MNIFTAVILVIVAFTVIVFLAYRKIIKLTFSLLTLTFFISLIAVLSTIFTPNVYQSASKRIFRDNFFAIQLEYFDNTLTDLSKVPNSLKNKIENIFRKEDKEYNESEFETQLYEQFIVLMGNILRMAVFVISIIGLFVTTYFRYAFASVAEAIKLRKELDALKLRVSELESKHI